VDHACNPAIWEEDIERIMVQGQASPKVCEDPISKIEQKWTEGVVHSAFQV
jgi:hypothetical protein